MYEQFFSLRRLPFEPSPDLRFFYQNSQHKEVIQQIHTKIKNRQGLVLITGERETGKTMWCHVLTDHLKTNAKLAMIPDSDVNPTEFLRAINIAFGIGDRKGNRKQLISKLKEELSKQQASGGYAVVVVDNSQDLPIDCFKLLSQLLNLTSDLGRLVQIILVGEPQIYHKLDQKETTGLHEYIAFRYQLAPFNSKDTSAYILFRLEASGAKNPSLFTKEAVQAIHKVSGGIPGRINALCDKALQSAQEKKAHMIDKGHIDHDVKDKRSPENVRETFTIHRSFAWTKQVVVLSLILIAAVIIWSNRGDRDARPDAPTGGMGSSLDSDGVSRVQAADQTERAAYLTLLGLWGTDLESSTIAIESQDIHQVVQRSGFVTKVIPTNLPEIRRLNYPFILQGHWSPGGDLAYVVLAGLTDVEALILDPLEGRRTIPLEDLVTQWSDEGTIFWKPLPGLEFPIDGEIPKGSVKILQQKLRDYGLYPGPLDGQMGPGTKNAIRFFQLRHGLIESGKFNTETHLVLSREVSQDVPKL